MYRVTDIFKEYGGANEVIIRIGPVDLIIPFYSWDHLECDSKDLDFGQFTSVDIKVMDRTEFIWLGKKIHSNKLEVLKSEFDYKNAYENRLTE